MLSYVMTTAGLSFAVSASTHSGGGASRSAAASEMEGEQIDRTLRGLLV